MNHSSSQRIFINQGDGQHYVDRYLDLGLTQGQKFPGSDPDSNAPTISQPGVYSYWLNNQWIIETHKLRKLGIQTPLVGSITPYRSKPQAVEYRGQVNVGQIAQEKKIIVTFELGDNSQLRLRDRQEFRYVGSPIELAVDWPLEHTYFGKLHISPSSNKFGFSPFLDRHGMGWLALNEDDLFGCFYHTGSQSRSVICSEWAK
ncbi:MAG: hypothetical protein AAGG02_11720 [Cyanobacteria bacterium P01_H01_bin.15]